MNEYFEQNKRSLLILVALFFLLAIVLYLLVLHPLLSDFAKKEKDIATVNEEIQLLEARIENFNIEDEEIDIEQLMFEKKIPVERELDKYILSLQQIETKTDSKIERIDFVYDSNLETIEEEPVTEEEVEPIDETEELNDDTDEESDEEENEEEQEAPTIDPTILREKPEDLQVMTVRVTAISPDYDDFINVLKFVEDEERISIVTRLHFTQPTETDLSFEQDPSKVIPFEIELTTFYYDK